MGENGFLTNLEVVIVSSKLEARVDAGVKRALSAHMAEELGSKKFLEAVHGGFHYIFKYNRMGKDGKMETRFHAEVKAGDWKSCYAEAKVKQLEQFKDLYYTGGETIGTVREMLKVVAGEEVANTFYPEYADNIPVDVIDDDSAIWLRDEYGIAPWHGGLRIPTEVTIYSDDQSNGIVEVGESVSGCSGFRFDHEDNFHNVFLTRRILGVFAKAWEQIDVISLNLDKLRENPATGSVVRLTGLREIVRPLNGD